MDEKNSTRAMRSFSEENPYINNFIAYLQTVDGKRRDLQTAKAIARDVSKYLLLFFAMKKRWNGTVFYPKIICSDLWSTLKI